MGDKSHLEPKCFPLPVEYFSIQRAAKFFECEEDDLWHMREIGAIQFCVKLDGMIPIKAIQFSDDAQQWHPFNGLFEQTSPNKFADIFRTTSNVNATLNGEAVARSPAYFVDGIWALSLDNDMENGDSSYLIDKQNILLETLIESGTECELIKTIMIRLSLDLDDELATKLFIMRADLIRILDSIQNGEPLRNRYNDDDIRIAAEKREKKLPPKRDTTGPFQLIEVLLKLMPETSDILYNPTTCFNVIETLCAKAKLENPIPKSTFESWIRKINAMS